MMLRIALADADATRVLGARLAALLRPRDVVLLEGDLETRIARVQSALAKRADNRFSGVA